MQNLDVRYSDRDLSEFKTLINEKLKNAQEELAELKNRLDGLEGQADERGGHSYGEDSKNHEQREMLTRLLERQAEKVHDLELALGRIANKTYGVDNDSGQLISKKRLMAYPTATSAMNGT